MMPDDAELLRRYLDDRSEAAFAELVQRHLGLVYQTALRRVGFDTHLAEDAAQIVFTDFARKAASLRGRASLAGWLYVSAHHASAQLVRTEQRRKAREIAAEAMQTLPKDSMPAPDWQQLRPVLDAAIVGLREDEREAITLRFFEQRSFADVGAALRLTEDAARKRVERALEKLRLLLARRGIASTTALLSLALGGLASTGAPAGLASKIAGGVLGHTTMATAGSGFAASLPAIAALVGLTLGGWAVFHQHRTNQDLAAELARDETEERTIGALRTENRQLAQRLRETDDLRRAAANQPAPHEQLRPAVASAAPPAPARATVIVQSDGRLVWENKPVTLLEFTTLLRNLERVAPDGNAKIGIRGFSEFPALAYAIDEARKAQVRHVVVESTATIDPKVGRGLWFGHR